MSRSHGLSTAQIISHIDKSESRILPISCQAELLGVSRSSVYYDPIPVSPEELDLMERIDKIYTDYPFYGSRKIARQLTLDLNRQVNRKPIQRLMREMGIEAVYPKRNLSVNISQHPTFPYLLKGIEITRPNHVWGTDITYLKLNGGFLYLTAVLDWYSRFVLSWELSNTLDSWFCLEAAKRAVSKFGLPQVTNSDQGVQYTSSDYLDFWQNKEVQISMDGRGRAMDNIFTERLWRTVKYEEVYLKSYQSETEARENLTKYFEFYNYRRLHETLGYQTPAQIYFERR